MTPAGNLAAEGAAAIAAAFPRALLGRWPSPLTPGARLAPALGLSELWIKRDDVSAEPYAGHKVRALEFLLAGLPPGAAVLTVGGAGSTHCLATAVYARRMGLKPFVAQFPQPRTPVVAAHAEAIAACVRELGGACRCARWRATFPLALAVTGLRALRHRPVHWIAPGASSPLGTVGYLLAGLELAAQAGEAGVAPPDVICVPLGSGGTTAGLLLALEWLAWPTAVLAVRVADAVVANRWRVMRLARRTARLVRRRAALDLPEPSAERLVVVTSELGAGYGHPTARGEEMTRAARELEGLALDPTYTAKALAGLAAAASGGRFRRAVFWHTFSARLP